MVEDKSTKHSGLSKVAGVKSQEHQHQHQHHAIQIIAQKVTQLYEVAKEIRSLLSTRPPGSRNKKELTSSPGSYMILRSKLRSKEKIPRFSPPSSTEKIPGFSPPSSKEEDSSEEEEDSTKEEEDSIDEEEVSNPRLGSSKATNKPSKHRLKNGKHPESLGRGKIIKKSPKVTTPPDRYERQEARINSPSSSRKRKHESESETEVEGNQKKRKVKKELKFYEK